MHRETHSFIAKCRLKGEQQKEGGSPHHQRQAESGMEDGLWSRLPDELVERVLPYLPVPDLCRFRSVCKRWNSLVCTPEFGTLCVQNASKGAGTGACVVFKLYAFTSFTSRIEIQSWSIFDLKARRWYNVKHELPKCYDYDRRTVGLDGGLVCTFVDAFTDEQRRTSTISNFPTTDQPQVLIISNLLGGTIKVLPNPPLVRINLPLVQLKLVVDNRSHTFKVVLINMAYNYYPRDGCCMCVYESSTNQWRIAPTPPNEYDLYRRIDPDTYSAWFQGLLYVFLPPPSNSLGQLYSYNFLEDAWQDTGVQFCNLGKISNMLDNIYDMVVSENRLFLMTQRLSNKRELQTAWTLDISEISFADRALRTVVRLTRSAEVNKNFSIEPDKRGGTRQYSIQAFGYGRSILLMYGITGKVIEYNLVTGLWEWLPPNPLESLHLPSIPHFSPDLVSRFGNLMNGSLCLPNTPWG